MGIIWPTVTLSASPLLIANSTLICPTNAIISRYILCPSLLKNMVHWSKVPLHCIAEKTHQSSLFISSYTFALELWQSGTVHCVKEKVPLSYTLTQCYTGTVHCSVEQNPLEFITSSGLHYWFAVYPQLSAHVITPVIDFFFNWMSFQWSMHTLHCKFLI